ncbi:hypothetical protein BD309DRAFT_379735 [Dichomitus squalens]|nr:hypothetical protein BD309DRAFT_379735 [Dichomitus squalens]
MAILLLKLLSSVSPGQCGSFALSGVFQAQLRRRSVGPKAFPVAHVAIKAYPWALLSPYIGFECRPRPGHIRVWLNQVTVYIMPTLLVESLFCYWSNVDIGLLL